ncbi:Uncharacterised protein [Mycobacteroides abscessus subsp. massiliense]|uniref:Uncharacterized protein n=3 Tax=Mycobacteroides abscessus TaxID=36809 RepID=A0A1U3NKE9_9MYCO|nr:hypothetical protein [Mycobacteroides abscessus]SIM77109.1 Uncharacterised protein [Mycobacteroides abscessus subsp. bolletii]SKL45563.1 Uncharacterised protein [Mycobacteroides abscessus subsp. massiliense]MBE5432164.1 hypothetical protein [Mycobacteroides abscessus]MBE5446118.1 hypothetical protein [Mycobacteroides abscessus]
MAMLSIATDRNGVLQMNDDIHYTKQIQDCVLAALDIIRTHHDADPDDATFEAQRWTAQSKFDYYIAKYGVSDMMVGFEDLAVTLLKSLCELRGMDLPAMIKLVQQHVQAQPARD